HEMLQQVAVVARDLDHHRALAESEACGGVDREAVGLLDPRGGIGGEISVVAEDLLRADDRLGLHEQAFAADSHMERKARLRFAELLRSQEGVRERHAAEIDEGPRQRRATEAAGQCWAHARALYRWRQKLKPTPSRADGRRPTDPPAAPGRAWCPSAARNRH